jgi:hypothetical protein
MPATSSMNASSSKRLIDEHLSRDRHHALDHRLEL